MAEIMTNESSNFSNTTQVDKAKATFLVTEVLVALLCIVGNSLVVVSFVSDRRLRTVTNYYIFSLSITDILVGILGIPTTAVAMSTGLPHVAWACILSHSWILMLCTVSIFHLVAVSLDRYLTIVHMISVKRTRCFKHSIAATFIFVSWVGGMAIGAVPIMGWNKVTSLGAHVDRCEFLRVFDIRFMIFVFYGTILLPTVPLLFFYRRVYSTAATQVTNLQMYNSGQTLNIRKARMKRRVTRSLLVVILAFLLSWYPLHILNLLTYHIPHLNIPLPVFYVAIVISHLNSAINPAIYAAMMSDFRRAIYNTLSCFSSPYREREPLLLTQFPVRYSKGQVQHFTPRRCVSERPVPLDRLPSSHRSTRRVDIDRRNSEKIASHPRQFSPGLNAHSHQYFNG